jgi:hypothetical protein
MNTFEINIDGQEYEIAPSLHNGFYTVTCGNKSAMIGKGFDGQWELSLQTSDALDISADRIGKAIEEYKPEHL